MPKRGICVCFCLIVFFNDTATTEIYTLSLHDALPILPTRAATTRLCRSSALPPRAISSTDRKSTRLNSSHLGSSYAVFCLKKKTITYAKNWKTPMLHSISNRDFRVPINNTLDNWSSLQRMKVPSRFLVFSFFFNDTATTEIYTLSLHDALPISSMTSCRFREGFRLFLREPPGES